MNIKVEKDNKIRHTYVCIGGVHSKLTFIKENNSPKNKERKK